MLGSEAFELIVTLSPTVTDVEAGSQRTTGGRFFLMTVISLEQVAVNSPSETVAVTVYFPGAIPVASNVAESPEPVIFPPLALKL